MFFFVVLFCFVISFFFPGAFNRKQELGKLIKSRHAGTSLNVGLCWSGGVFVSSHRS